MPENSTAPAPLLRWGIIGCGDVCERKSGPALARAAGSTLVAVMRRDAAAAADFATRHGVAASYGNVADLLADPAVNAVYIATPPASHAELVAAAAAAGKRAILVEKPMATSAAECDAMLTACASHGVALYTAYYRRAYPKFKAARAAIVADAIGRPLGARLEMAAASGSGGWRVNDPRVAGAGGCIADVGSHRLDMLCYLLGGEPTGITGHADNLQRSYAAESDAVLVFRLGGALVSAHFHFGVVTPPRDVLVIYGTRGTLVFDPFDGPSFSIVSSRGDATVHAFETPSPVHLPLVEAIVDDCARRSAGFDAAVDLVATPGAEGARASRILDALFSSKQVRE